MVKQPTGQVTHGSAPYCAPEASDALSQGRPRPLRRSLGHSVTATRLLRVVGPQLDGHDSIMANRLLRLAAPPARAAAAQPRAGRMRSQAGRYGLVKQVPAMRRHRGPCPGRAVCSARQATYALGLVLAMEYRQAP